MKCTDCGKELENGMSTCSVCHGITEQSVTEAPKKKGRTGLWILGLAVLILASAVALILSTGNTDKIKLPYAWGTSREHIMENETVLAEHGKLVKCRISLDNVAGISEFGVYHDEVSFTFDEETERLTSIGYVIDLGDGMHGKERLEVLKKYYGDHYYKDEAGFYYWWSGDTVVMYYAKELLYMHESDFIGGPKWQEVRDFFGK